MESVVISSGHYLGTPFHHSDDLTNKFHYHLARHDVNIRRHQFRASSKKSSFPDFQDYAKPRRLLPSRGLKSIGVESPDRFISSLQSHGSQCVYKVLLRTSSIYGSDLSDINTGVLICIIDEHGDSILERIPAILLEDHAQQSDNIHFQRGSIDEIVFWGPKLGRIQALWIGLESGKWRLGGASLTTISSHDHRLAEESSTNGNVYCSFTYNFEVEDVLLGEDSGTAMVELRTCQVTEYSGANPSSLLGTDAGQAASIAERRMTNEASMREYADLKYSLLLYDSLLIFAGTSILSVIAGEDTAKAFLTGGIGGFLYLLLLQRSVDKLPAPESDVMSNRSYFDRLFGGVKGPLLVVAFAFGVAVLAIKRDTSDFEAALAPREIVAGMIGFLACKVSVVLAAIKPMSMGMDDNK